MIPTHIQISTNRLDIRLIYNNNNNDINNFVIACPKKKKEGEDYQPCKKLSSVIPDVVPNNGEDTNGNIDGGVLQKDSISGRGTLPFGAMVQGARRET